MVKSRHYVLLLLIGTWILSFFHNERSVVSEQFVDFLIALIFTCYVVASESDHEDS